MLSIFFMLLVFSLIFCASQLLLEVCLQRIIILKVKMQRNQYSPVCLRPFIIWTLRSFCGTVIVEFYIHGEM